MSWRWSLAAARADPRPADGLARGEPYRERQRRRTHRPDDRPWRRGAGARRRGRASQHPHAPRRSALPGPRRDHRAAAHRGPNDRRAQAESARAEPARAEAARPELRGPSRSGSSPSSPRSSARRLARPRPLSCPASVPTTGRSEPRADRWLRRPARQRFAPPPAQPGPQLRWTTGPQPAVQPAAHHATSAPAQPIVRAAPARQAAVAAVDPVNTASSPQPAAHASAAKAAPAAQALPARTGFVIQLGATDDEGKARAILDNAKSRNRTILADASAFTEKVQKAMPRSSGPASAASTTTRKRPPLAAR